MHSEPPPRQLPGGLPEAGTLARAYAFRPLDGALELALGEAVLDAPCTPAAVTRALCATLASLAGAPPTPQRVDALCVADRQYLMRELQCLCGHAIEWLTATCTACGERFDLEVDLRALPVTPAPEGFPQARGDWQGQAWEARLPDGADQRWLAAQPAPALEQRLAQRLLQGGTDPALRAGPLPPALLEAIDAALAAVSPALVSELAAACPECGHVNAVAADPYGGLGGGLDDLLQQVHTLASHYHWGEAEILGLPRSRRQAYLALLDADAGPR